MKCREDENGTREKRGERKRGREKREESDDREKRDLLFPLYVGYNFEDELSQIATKSNLIRL